MDFTKLTPRPRKAFTLIEIMLVVSIITLLISLTLPALGQARAKASTVVCGTRLNMLGKAMHVYLAEFNETFPINGLLLPKNGSPIMYKPAQGVDPKFAACLEPNQQKWRLEFGALWPYMSGATPPPGYKLPLPLSSETVRKAFACPDDWPTMKRTYSGTSDPPLYLSPMANGTGMQVLLKDNSDANKMTPVTGGYWSYSVNSVLNSLGRFRDRFNTGELPWRDPLRTSRVYNSEFICFVEESNESLFNDEVFDSPAFNAGDLLTNRHNKNGNVGMLDGSVQSFSASIFNNVPSGVQAPDGSALQYVDPITPMSSPITRMFFPDAGAFITVDPSAVATAP